MIDFNNLTVWCELCFSKKQLPSYPARLQVLQVDTGLMIRECDYY